MLFHTVPYRRSVRLSDTDIFPVMNSVTHCIERHAVLNNSCPPGADEVIDYTAQNDLVAKLPRRNVMLDCIIDNIGLPSSLHYQCHNLLEEYGDFAQVGASTLITFLRRIGWPSFLGGGQRKYVVVMTKFTRGNWRSWGIGCRKTRFKFSSTASLSFTKQEKLEKLRSARARGKTLVHVSDPNHRSMESFSIGFR